MSVMIISLVIMAIFSMKGNNTFLLQQSQSQSTIQHYQTLLLDNPTYGFADDNLSLERLVDGFVLEDSLRRELKQQKITIHYEVLSSMEQEDATFFELGKTTTKTATNSVSLMRLRGL